jgi:hypothetical protein
MTWRNARKQEWVFPLFSPDSDDRLSLNFHKFVILYISCDTRNVGLGQHCLPKPLINSSIHVQCICKIILSLLQSPHLGELLPHMLSKLFVISNLHFKLIQTGPTARDGAVLGLSGWELYGTLCKREF